MSALRAMIDEATDEARRRYDARMIAEGPQSYNIHTNAAGDAAQHPLFAATSGAIGGSDNDAETDPASAYDAGLMNMLVDWPTFWKREETAATWVAEPVLAEGRAHAIYAPGGTGKSLFSLWLAAALASGRAGLDGHPLTPRRVLYLDYEMTQDDLLERLAAMSYDETCNLSNLSYALLPSLPPADAPEGGKAIARMAQLVDAELVILDTFSRAVSGDENDADTVRNFYRWTGLHLKAEGRAFCRIDHAGKDIEKGQRGSSAKNDDVDVVWQMVKADGGFRLTAKKRRMGWVPETVALMQYDEPNLHYKVAATIDPAGTDKVVRDLDDLGVPTMASARTAAKSLKDAGRGARDQLVRAAQKRRSSVWIAADFSRDAHRDAPLDERRDAHRDALDENMHPQGRTRTGTHRDAPPDASGTRSVPLGTDAPSVHPKPTAKLSPPPMTDPWAF
jgi:hypothetical protein